MFSQALLLRCTEGTSLRGSFYAVEVQCGTEKQRNVRMVVVLWEHFSFNVE